MYLTEIWRHINSLKHYHHNRRRRHRLHHPNHYIKLTLMKFTFRNLSFFLFLLLLHDWSVLCTLRDKAKYISRFRLAKTLFRILVPNMSFLALIIQTVHDRSVVCVITNRILSTLSTYSRKPFFGINYVSLSIVYIVHTL